MSLSRLFALFTVACVLLQPVFVAARPVPPPPPPLSLPANVSLRVLVDAASVASTHAHSRLFEHFDVDSDGKLDEKEVAALLKLLTKKKTEHHPSAHTDKPPGTHDITIDGETLSVGQGEFDLLFKQLSNLKQTKDPSKDPRMTLQEDIIFVKDLVIVFSAATIAGVVATNFRQPPLIGFLLGGMTVGPGGLGIVTELVEVETLASLGIAFLLFSLGVEFSITELQGVRRVVVAGGISSMIGIVLGTGALSFILSLVKSIPEAVALGLAVSLSSTAVVLQCLSASSQGAPHPTHSSHNSLHETTHPGSDDEKHAHHTASPPDTPSVPMGKTSMFNFDAPRSRKTMLGLLVFQDVMIGLILALLPTLQGSVGQFLEEFMSAILRLGCFVILSLILAEFVLPTLSERLDASKSQEVFTIGCVVFCLAMSYLSEEMGLAIELGAFAAGMMLSESRHKHRVESSVESIRTVFSAIFFISVGMMIHWRYFYLNFAKIAVLLVVILVVKSIVMGAVICVLGGLPLRTSMACGAAIAQAGEFTFVVASKGQALLLFSASEARMINGATALSMLATPYIIRFARRWAAQGAQRGDTPSA
ncbi:K(+) efflux antiporter 5 [Gracilariopsis chorda]|uniref:K(+) efflux antiporter 5 n=1 Tax=Gracilariopsis chorda TaxID=448386 RepID=A0A2V3J226_9FLOR|nr:K(+) efflux antiporter 5 [Gracilariopsis chorda]|eukprot:PXF48438.1 K(+) efflux antiporter 5 [Gracilariopsis chorda]